MYNIYAIIYDLKSIFHNYSPLYEELKSSGMWWHFIRDLWLIRTNENVGQIMDRIRPYIEKNDSILIIKVDDVENFQGWLPKDAWNWINDVFLDMINPPSIDSSNLRVHLGDRELIFEWKKLIGITGYYVKLMYENITIADSELDQSQNSIKFTELENKKEYIFHIQTINNGARSVEKTISGIPCCPQPKITFKISD